MSSGTASILDTRPETLSFTHDLYTQSLTAKYLQQFIFFLLNFIRTMHSGEIVPSFHSAFVLHSPRGSSQSQCAFFAMWVPLLRNSDLPYLACSGSSSISWSASTFSRGAGGKVFVLTPARAEVRTGSLDGTHPRRPRGRKWGRGKVLTGLHYLPLGLRGWVVRCQGNKPGGWTPHVKGVGKLVVLLRGVNIGFWSHIGCSRQTAIIFSREGLV